MRSLLECSRALIVTACSLLVRTVDCGERDVSVSNSTYYSTREMRDKVLNEWAGKTEEVQQYFDQLPSKEFRETSADLKFKLYWERKGLEKLRSNEVFNITPQVRHPQGPEYTIEVNDSYVPKYRITTSEERRMELYGTFNSESSESSTASASSELKPTTEPPDSGEKKPNDKRGKKGQKKWPPHMNPKQRRKKRKKAKMNGANNSQNKNNQIALLRMTRNHHQARNKISPNNNKRNDFFKSKPRTFQIQMSPNNDWLKYKDYKQENRLNQKNRNHKTVSIYTHFMSKVHKKSYPEIQLKNSLLI